MNRASKRPTIENQDDVSVKDEIAMIERAKRKAKEEKSLPAFPLEYSSPFSLIMAAHIQRKNWGDRLLLSEKPSGESDENYLIRNTFVGQEATFSSTPLDQLAPISLQEMKVRQSHKGKYLLCRIIAPPFRIVAISLVVEDTRGWAQILSIYNYPGTYSARGPELDAIFPLDSVIAIREPYPKMALAAAHSHIRIDSPTDIIFLEPGNQLLANVRWSTGTRPLPVLTKTANEWKAMGDQHFRSKEYYGATKCYSFALLRNPSLLAVRLNRSLTYLRLKWNSYAIEDAEFVLSKNPLSTVDRSKALYRCAQGAYGNGEYLTARKLYEECLVVDPALQEAAAGISKCNTRIQEQESGTYDWYTIFETGKRDGTCGDVSDFVGPVERASMKHRGGGRGIRATRKIDTGELLVVSKPFASASLRSFSSEGHFFSMNFINNSMGDEHRYVVIQRTIERMLSNPHDANSLLELYGGPQYPTTASSTKKSKIPLSTPLDLDSTRVQAICTLNVFGKHSSRGDILSKTQDSTTALYTFPSYFNHSCMPNGAREMIGDLMYIRAVRSVEAGEEVTLTYHGHESSYEDRSKVLTQWFPHCDCILCEHDRANGESNRKEREAILQKANGAKIGVKELRLHSKHIEATYTGSYGPYRPAVSRVYQILASKLQDEGLRTRIGKKNMQRGRLLFTEAIQAGFCALESLGMRIIDKRVDGIPVDHNLDLPISRDFLPYNVDTCMNLMFAIIGAFEQKEEFGATEMWMRAAIWRKIHSLLHQRFIDSFRLQSTTHGRVAGSSSLN
ncbi:hypothetical protein M408DRAFT_76061 [Serendipita vermifera MAFF 305830]|uniref:SET domain-containing protein n=1 Tax=Serendipita vermifera MAFF 305830 TaxID=933852 RepID=A0A0C3AI12_SERVB|nr:hypothetical protein M408DRAFT_76061 [Serendipita vermifera MAFF 305830]